MSMAPSIRPSSTWSRGSNPSAAKSRGVPTVSSTTKSSSPPAGASSAARLGIDSTAACQASSASVCAASAALTSAASVLGPGEQRLLLLALRLRDLLAERLLLAPLGLEVGDRPRGARCRRPAPRRPPSSDSPRLAWAARTRSGSSRRMRGSITLVKASRRAASDLTPRFAGALADPAYFCPCSTDRGSSSWAGRCCRSCCSALRDARGRPGLGARRAVRQPRVAGGRVRRRLGLADPAAAGRRGRSSGPSG